MLPCDLLPDRAPDVADREAAPIGTEILAQLLTMTPRGPAWGTDEAGDGRGASPMLLRLWRGLADIYAPLWALTFATAVQCFPSAASTLLEAWEHELGLPDPCLSPGQTTTERVRAVRMRHMARGGCSPGYFICLARALGYTVTITEPTAFRCGRSRLGNRAPGSHALGIRAQHDVWRVRITTRASVRFRAGARSRLGRGDPLLRIPRAIDLECAFRAQAPAHLSLVFDYS